MNTVKVKAKTLDAGILEGLCLLVCPGPGRDRRRQAQAQDNTIQGQGNLKTSSTQAYLCM